MLEINSSPQIESASLIWQDGIPASRQFEDVYFCRENGLEESRYVFLHHNQLAERFSCVSSGGHFVVAETGFGSGLNFLATWLSWLTTKPNHPATLHFVSVERFPLTKSDLADILALWPELEALAKELLNAYPPLVHGTHRLTFNEGSVRLTLYFGDAIDAWKALNFKADAWFLDGFAPARNPDMWLDQVFSQIRAHSRPGTTIATFTAVGRIKRALESSGFVMDKVKGFGRKRNMLCGRLSDLPPEESNSAKSVTIIGAGIAGCLLARNLADRGIGVTLIDAAEHAGTAASGNRQGAVYAKLGVEFNDYTQLTLSSLLFSQRFYPLYGKEYWHPTGLLQLAWSPRECERQQHLLTRNSYPANILFPVDKQTASQLTGVSTLAGGIWFPDNGWLEPQKLCNSLIEHKLITKKFGFTVDKLTTGRDNSWQISRKNHPPIYASHVIICAGHRTPTLMPGSGQLHFKSVRGQVTHLSRNELTAPMAVICGQRYISPSNDGIATVGSTFDPDDDNPKMTTASHLENLAGLQNMLPNLLHANFTSTMPDESLNKLEGKTAFRCTTHDYQPVAGEYRDAENKTVAGMYLFTGLGSKGLTYAPLLAEYVADILCGQPACLPAHLIKRVGTHRMHIPEMAQ